MKKTIWAVILTILAGLNCPANEEPILRAGIMTDTHIRETAESCAHVREAFKLFRKLKAELIINLGDIADEHYPSGYRHYRNIFNEVFPGEKPEELFVFAGHDARGFKDVNEAYKIVEKEIGARNSIYGKLVLKGYPFLVFRQGPDLKRYEAEIEQAEREFPGKPIFVLNHEPPLNTTYHSRVWGSPQLRTVLERHPRVVQFSGHAHSSVRDERNIWQGKFTSISAGCLQRWAGVLAGTPPQGQVSDGVLLLEVYPEKLVIRRFEYTTGQEYGANQRWIVPLPFDEKTAPYAPERRNQVTPAPEFPAGSVLKSTLNAGGLHLQFPEAGQGTAEYRIEMEKQGLNGKWVPFARRDIFSGLYQKKAPAFQKTVLNPGYFTPGEKYRATVSPMSFWHKCGKPLTLEFTAPEWPKPVAVTEYTDPMKELRFNISRTGKPIPERDGFFVMKARQGANLEIPQEAWAGPAKKARFRLIADFHGKLDSDIPWVILALDPKKNHRATSRIGTVPGDAGVMRYVMEFNKHREDSCYVLQFRNGGPGKIRFDKIRIERIR